MDRGNWAAPEKMQNLIFAFNGMSKTITVFASKKEAIANVQGLEIAEGNWRFFSADGSPMEANFSIPARIYAERNTYTNGVYTLEPTATGSSLYTLLSIVDCDDHARSGLYTLRDVEQFLLDQITSGDADNP
jgi:hypothetical protein